jgi:23S rRNA pseudouridine1911/1915/1917 synthase
MASSDLTYSLKMNEDESTPQRLDLFLSRKTGLARAFIQQQMKKGRVHLNSEVILRPSTKVKTGDLIFCEFKESSFSTLEPLDGNLEILFEDADFLAVNKAQGVVVHPAPGHQGETLVHHLLHYLSQSDFSSLSPSRPGIVHRLDRGTSGVILVAKNRAAQEKLSLQFKERLMKKEYECLVWGRTKLSGTIATPIGRHNWDRMKMSAKSRVAREAKTVWKKKTDFNHFTLLDVFPETGRTHQIRVHLSEVGHPIVGDSIYATRSTQGRIQQLTNAVARKVLETTDTFLHARAITLNHPTTGAILKIEAKRPPAFEDFLSLLEKEDRDDPRTH